MAPEEKNDESLQKKGKPARWGLTLLLLLFFLAGGGFYALNSMKGAARGLASDANQGELTDDSLYSAEGRPGGAETVFSAEQTAAAPQKGGGSALNPGLKPGWVKEMVASRAASGGLGGSQAGGSPEEEGRAEQGGAGSGSSAAQDNDGAMGARLQARAGFKPSAPAANKTSAQTAPMQFGGAEIGKPSVQRETKAASPKKAAGGGVMDALKGAFRATFYGARIASQDSAKSWVARAFDANEEPNTAIEYDAKMKKELDVVNPNSIPKFLREQDISAAEAKTLTAAKVTKPEGDLDGTKAALKEDKEFQKKNMGKEVTDGVLNGLFSGVAKSGSDDGEEYTAPEGVTNLNAGGESPAGLMSLYQTDEYGNTTVPCGDGLSCIFGPDGGILGCEDPSAGMCLMAGASDACSADMTLGDFTGGGM